MATEAQSTKQERALFDESVYEGGDYDPFRVRSWPRPQDDWDRIERDKAKLDPITIDVVEGGLESAIEEAEAAVERTARGTVIREQHDYRASVNSLDCDTVTRVSWGATADPIRSYYELDEINEGDVFIYNDVYESQGAISHLPDYSIVIPVFAEGRIIAFAQIFGHTTDVGGRVVGSWPITSTNVFEEGIQVPPVKLYQAGERNEEVYKIILRNSRFPEEMRGDIDALVGATRIMERQIRGMCDRLGADVVEAAIYRIMDRCAEAVRDVILPMFPDGEYFGEDFLDNDGVTLDRPIKLKVTIKKDAEKILLDWTGTDPQTEGPVNFVGGGRFLSKWLGSFFKQFDPGTLMNEGVTRVVRNYLPPGTVMSPKYPAGVSNRMFTMFRNIGAYSSALAKAFGGGVTSDFDCVQIYGFYGEDEEGKLFLYREIFGGGSGARPTADGTDAVDMVPNSKNLPAEFIEQRYPLIVEAVGLNPDSGGVGKYRGGLGYLKEIRPLVDGFFLTNVGRTVFSPFGVSGGGAGMPGESWIDPDGPARQHILFSREAIAVKAGQIIRLTTPGGGGWGDPLEREAEAVRLDVLRGLVTVESARNDYGVVVNEKQNDLLVDFEVDETATEQLRAELRDTRPPLKLIDRGRYADKLKAEGVIEFDDDPHVAPVSG